MSPVVDAAELSACGSHRCRSKIRLVTLLAGGTVPVDLSLEPGGAFVPVIGPRGARRVRPRVAGDGDRPGFTAHADSCPDMTYWAAHRGGTRERRGVELGRCAGCRAGGHLAYGPDCVSTLCPDCRVVLAAWRAAGPGHGPLRYVTAPPA